MYIMMVAAILPAVLLLIMVYRLDKIEKEPVGLIVSLVFLGIVSIIIAMICEYIGEGILNLFATEGSFIYRLIDYFIVVGISEECAKYLLLRLRTWKSKEFDCLFDGVVYAVSISLGFALFENIFYVFSFGLGTAILRAVTAVPGHACFGVFMGIFYAYAKRSYDYGDMRTSKLFRLLALLAPIYIHGLYDFIASSETVLSALIFIVFVVALFVIARKLILNMSQIDHYI